MAKVTGPLMSLTASGKFGKALVFSKWKSSPYARVLVTPKNPMTSGQGDVRVIAGGTGRACGEVKPLSDFDNRIIAAGLVPGGQSKQSYLVKYIMDHYFVSGGHISTTLYAAELAALTGHTAYTVFQAAAATLGLVEFDLDYASVDAYLPALGIYELAKFGFAVGFTSAPFATALASWTAAQINAFIAEFTAP